MKKGIRANFIVARFLNARPDYESADEFSHRIGLTYSLDMKRLHSRADVTCGLLYRVCKAFGYQIIVYNPKPPKGLDSMYVIGTGKAPITPREDIGKYVIKRDKYTGEIYREKRKYKRKTQKKYIKVA